MKITHVEVEIVDLPADEPLAGAIKNPTGVRPTVILTLGTDAGIQGIGFTFLGAGLTRALHASIEDLANLMIGEDPLCRERIARKARDFAVGAGPAGIFTLSMAAIDVALWDIAGKAADLPLWKLLGGSGAPVQTYASGAMMRGFDLNIAEAAAAKLVDDGFRAMKMQLALPGDTNVEKEVERARTIRNAIGPKIDLMCDINQRWRVDQAISIGQRLEEFGFAWLEDITIPEDIAGLSRVAAALSTPLAGGEYLYGLTPFRDMAVAASVDIIMIDAFRAGGITPFLKIAALAEAFSLPVVSHLAPEVLVHVMGAIPNGLTVEYMPWSVRLFEEVPKPDKGQLHMPTGHGLGLTFDKSAIAHFRR
jgi:L-alanine-DL-glutamate epimerase-like enolase superfamily enzyme